MWRAYIKSVYIHAAIAALTVYYTESLEALKAAKKLETRIARMNKRKLKKMNSEVQKVLDANRIKKDNDDNFRSLLYKINGDLSAELTC